MASAQLTASSRADYGKGAARQLRLAGKVPGIIYGHARQPQALTMDARELEKLLDRVTAESTVIELSLDGAMTRTLIREIQRNPLRKQILHVDFQELVAGEKVTVRIPLVMVGVPEGVRTGGGILDQTMRDIEVRCDAMSIPNHVDVDVANLTIGHSVHVSDLKLPEGVEVLEDEDATVCVVSVPKVVAEPVAAEAVEAPAEPELIRKTKADEDEEAEKEKK